jgi:hypothetical protein
VEYDEPVIDRFVNVTLDTVDRYPDGGFKGFQCVIWKMPGEATVGDIEDMFHGTHTFST